MFHLRSFSLHFLLFASVCGQDIREWGHFCGEQAHPWGQGEEKKQPPLQYKQCHRGSGSPRVGSGHPAICALPSGEADQPHICHGGQRLRAERNCTVWVHTKHIVNAVEVLLVVDVIACVLFLVFKTRLWLIRGVGTAWTDEENDYNYKRLLGPEQSKMLTVTRARPSGVCMVVKYD